MGDPLDGIKWTMADWKKIGMTQERIKCACVAMTTIGKPSNLQESAGDPSCHAGGKRTLDNAPP
jgi:hypothetical protein